MTVVSKTSITHPDGSVQSSAGYTPFRNKIRNGGMLFDQRGSATTAVTAGGSTINATAGNAGYRYTIATVGTTTYPNPVASTGYWYTSPQIALTGSGTVYASPYTLDGWYATGIGTGVISVQQTADTPLGSGFNNSLRVSVTTSIAIGSSNAYLIGQTIETADLIELAQTTPLKTLSLSFWVKSSVAGTYSVSVGTNNGTNGSATPAFITKDFSITASNTWQYVTIPNVQMPSSGTADDIATSGLAVFFSLGVGSSYSQAPGTWGSALAFGSTNQTSSFMAATGNTFFLTGVQLEFNQASTPFEVLDYVYEQKRNQRFFLKFLGNHLFERLPGLGVFSSTSQGYFVLNLPVQMSTFVGFPAMFPSGSIYTSSAGTTYNISTLRMTSTNTVSVVPSVTAVANQQFIIMANNSTSAFITLSSEL